jgi:nicotinamidase-related amidase
LARFGASADDGGVIERLHLRVALRAGHPLRGLGVDTVVIAGVTTENCCHATARDAFFRNYRVVFVSDATGAPDYLDVGQGGMSGDEVHQAALVVLSNSTADVLSTDEFLAQTPVPQLAPALVA